MKFLFFFWSENSVRCPINRTTDIINKYQCDCIRLFCTAYCQSYFNVSSLLLIECLLHAVIQYWKSKQWQNRPKGLVYTIAHTANWHVNGSRKCISYRQVDNSSTRATLKSLIKKKDSLTQTFFCLLRCLRKDKTTG